MTKALASVCTLAYAPMFEMMLHTYIEHHKDDIPWIIFTDGSLTDEIIYRWNNIYKNIIIKIVDDKLYKKYKMSKHFYAFETYRLSDYDRVVFFDADLFFIGNIDRLWDTELTKEKPIAMKKEVFRNSHNSGLVIISDHILNEKTYNELYNLDPLKCGDYFGNDQKVLNFYFNNRIKALNVRYNCFLGEESFCHDALVYHWFIKPWASGYKKRVNKRMRDMFAKKYNEKVSQFYERI